MRIFKSLFITIFITYSISTSYAENFIECAAKKNSIETQLKNTPPHGNTHKVKILEKSMQENIEKCSNLQPKVAKKNSVLEDKIKTETIELKLQHANNTSNLDNSDKKQSKFKLTKQESNKEKGYSNTKYNLSIQHIS